MVDWQYTAKQQHFVHGTRQNGLPGKHAYDVNHHIHKSAAEEDCLSYGRGIGRLTNIEGGVVAGLDDQHPIGGIGSIDANPALRLRA